MLKTLGWDTEELPSVKVDDNGSPFMYVQNGTEIRQVGVQGHQMCPYFPHYTCSMDIFHYHTDHVGKVDRKRNGMEQRSGETLKPMKQTLTLLPVSCRIHQSSTWN